MKRPGNEKKGGVKSPCIKKCSLDAKGICPACYRSLGEIASWPDADDDARRRILAAAKLRREGKK